MGGPVLDARDVSVRFALPHRTPFGPAPCVLALDRVDLSVAPGEAVALVGESGSGKSTLLRVAAGLIEPNEGVVRRAAADGPDRPQIVHQDAVASFTPWLTVGQQIGDRLRPLRPTRAERDRRVAEALAMAGLPGAADALPGELSGGQCQRAAIARAVVVPPTLLLCDEPISAMDVSLAAQTLNLLGHLRRELGMALVFVTHDLAAARLVADRIVVMRDGRVVEVGPSERLTSAPTTDYARALLDAIPTMPAPEAA